MELRNYQNRAVKEVRRAWSQGAKRVCLVMPTGAGKTVTAAAITEGLNPLWLVHRREIQHQAPGRAITVQKLVSSGDRPQADILIADECHHLAPAAQEWHAVAEYYPKILGLTATPQRGDGSPLGDLFDHLVVGAKYSELLKAKHIVKAEVFRPPEVLEGLAQEPVPAYLKFGGSLQGFAYFSRVEHAQKFAQHFGDQSNIITAKTKKPLRDLILARFRAQQIQVLSNVFTLTEGIDVPEASVCLIARGCQHQGTYLQMVGRVLRSAPNKEKAIVIDLSGVSHIHGLPTEDRIYSLDGRAIRAKLEPLRNCPECGYTQPSALPRCEKCGYEFPVKPARKVRVWDVPLEQAIAQALTPKERGIARYREKMAAMGNDGRRAEFQKLKAIGESKGYKPGWAKFQYKFRFGAWPNRGITG